MFFKNPSSFEIFSFVCIELPETFDIWKSAHATPSMLLSQNKEVLFYPLFYQDPFFYILTFLNPNFFGKICHIL